MKTPLSLMDFMPLQGVKLRFAVAGRRACICGPDSPQPATAGPATAKRGFTISITVFCRVWTNKNNEAKRCLSSGFPRTDRGEYPNLHARITAELRDLCRTIRWTTSICRWRKVF
ncbi:hypothetical protein F9939_00350 [Bacteroides stercoris]|nr:hypothetical protein F9953_00430 [Bacteroides stercoris]KAB5314706.1 hypothetical protein F9939_00350 [Bacteroides stercoris]KAB5329657.1 hypothetical protein F9951_00350 [Bacteroides stercoris]KAB5350797.1 hypothetical protein F9940_13460 [Bacteroides stercoris]